MIARFNRAVQHLPALAGELESLASQSVAQPEEFLRVSHGIMRRFQHMGRSGANQPITPADLDHCLDLLREFQELTNPPPTEADESRESGGTQVAAVPESKIEAMRRGVNQGMLYIAEEAIQTGISGTNALNLGSVNAFNQIMKPAQKLVELSYNGLAADARTRGEDPLAFGEDIALSLHGGAAYRGIDDDLEDLSTDTQGQGGRFAGQSRR